MNIKECHKELQQSLPQSTANDRKRWAALIIQNDLDIEDLATLLSDKKTSLRFQWLLSEVGLLKPEKLYAVLPFLLEQNNVTDPSEFKIAFATYWSIVGIPVENEAIAINLLFEWLMSPQVNVTTKSRSLSVLFKLSQKYPDLKNELAVCIQDHIDQYTGDFKKKSEKILMALENS